jgi:D-beta-D-heptose 7-phosphate kinase/D-beta-D-heptose 1-phosphate adenosyltransferase
MEGNSSRVLVVGDVMLDHYIFGNSSRLSPEAPVPVVVFDTEDFMLGGCGNLLRNLDAFEIRTTLITVVGLDSFGERISEELSKLKHNKAVLIKSAQRRSTSKQRIISRQQQIVRLDSESTMNLSEEEESDFLMTFRHELNSCDLVVISDYNKGVISETLAEKLISLCNVSGVDVFVDPKKKSFACYSKATLVKPNLLEAELAIGQQLDSILNIGQAARRIRENYQIPNIVITLGSRGVFYLSDEEGFVNGLEVKIADVSGAGDTFLAGLVYGHIRGWCILDSVKFSNCAASIVVQNFGSVVTSVKDVNKLLNDGIVKKAN